METLEHELRSHPFVGDLEPAYLTLLAGRATNVEFAAGAFLTTRTGCTRPTGG